MTENTKAVEGRVVPSIPFTVKEVRVPSGWTIDGDALAAGVLRLVHEGDGAQMLRFKDDENVKAWPGGACWSGEPVCIRFSDTHLAQPAVAEGVDPFGPVSPEELEAAREPVRIPRALSTPQPDTAQGERGAVQGEHITYDSAADLAEEMEEQAEVAFNADCCNATFPINANRRLLRDSAALIRKLTTPTGDQDARAVGGSTFLLSLGGTEAAPLEIAHRVDREDGSEYIVFAMPAIVARQITPPAPVAQAWDERLTVCIEGIGKAKMALMSGDPQKARERLDAVSDKLDALAHTQESAPVAQVGDGVAELIAADHEYDAARDGFDSRTATADQIARLNAAVIRRREALARTQETNDGR